MTELVKCRICGVLPTLESWDATHKHGFMSQIHQMQQSSYEASLFERLRSQYAYRRHPDWCCFGLTEEEIQKKSTPLFSAAVKCSCIHHACSSHYGNSVEGIRAAEEGAIKSYVSYQERLTPQEVKIEKISRSIKELNKKIDDIPDLKKRFNNYLEWREQKDKIKHLWNAGICLSFVVTWAWIIFK